MPRWRTWRTADLAPLTTLGIGGPAEVIDLDDAAELPTIATALTRRGVRPVCLGSGSNVLVSDAGCAVPVLRIGTHGVKATSDRDSDRVLVTAEAGHSLLALVEFAVEQGLVGMETLIGIPGTVGATPIQNVGAYGQETADTLVEVVAWDWDLGRQVVLSVTDCGFGHRTSVFKRSDRWTILRVTHALARAPLSAPVIYRELAEALHVPLGARLPLRVVTSTVLAVRRRKGMVLDHGDPDARSVGSVFLSTTVSEEQATRLRKRGASVHMYPDGGTRVGASWLLREAGFRLSQPMRPGIRMSHKHYTLVAENTATASDFALAVETLQQQTLRATGVLLSPEPDLIGNDSTYQRLTGSALTTG